MGNRSLAVGLDGNRIGFSIAAKGIQGGVLLGDGSLWPPNQAPVIEILSPVEGDLLQDGLVLEFIVGDPDGDYIDVSFGLNRWVDGVITDSYSITLLPAYLRITQWEVNRVTFPLRSLQELGLGGDDFTLVITAWDYTENWNVGASGWKEGGHFSLHRTPPECPGCNMDHIIPETGQAGEMVGFEVDVSATEGMAFWGESNVTWDFGDGTTDSGWFVSHVYRETDAPKRAYDVVVCIEFPDLTKHCEGDVVVVESDVEPFAPDFSGWAIEGSILFMLFTLFAVIIVLVARSAKKG